MPSPADDSNVTGGFIFRQTYTQSLLCMRAVLDRKYLVSSRCIKVTFLPTSQGPLRVNFPFDIQFARINKWRLGTILTRRPF